MGRKVAMRPLERHQGWVAKKRLEIMGTVFGNMVMTQGFHRLFQPIGFS